MKKPDLTKYKTTSTLYLLILIIAAVALFFHAFCFFPGTAPAQKEAG